jgi:hypothetical protein
MPRQTNQSRSWCFGAPVIIACTESLHMVPVFGSAAKPQPEAH